MACSGALCTMICGALTLGGCAAGCSATAAIGFAPASWASGATGSSTAAGTSYFTS